MYCSKRALRCLSALLAAVTCLFCFVSCRTENNSQESTEVSQEVQVIPESSESQSSKIKHSGQVSKTEGSKSEKSEAGSSAESSEQASPEEKSSEPESSEAVSSEVVSYEPVSSEPQSSEPEQIVSVVSSEPESVPESSAEVLIPPKNVPIYRGRNPGIFPDELLTIPWDYYKPVEGARPIEVVSYTHRGHTKNVSVYLPPNYDEKKNYNVLYLLGGVTANEWAFFKRGDKPDYFKYALDHMISNKEMDPVIICNVSFFPSDDIRLGDMPFSEMLEDFDDELRNCIIPAVEYEYSSYMRNMTEWGIIDSRKHRAFGGFSMGAAVTWHVLSHCTDYFYYYLPMSGGSFETENLDYDDNVGGSLKSNLQRLGFDKNDFFVFACEGTEDHTKNKMDTHVSYLRNGYPELFEFTDNNKFQGNITYKYKQGGEHNYVCAYEYARSGIHAFWEL